MAGPANRGAAAGVISGSRLAGAAKVKDLRDDDSTYQVIDFANIGNVTCTLYGYPGVSFAGGTPVKQIGLAAVESNVTARKLVTLAPGAVANALLRIVHAQNYPASKCQLVTATYLQIYPPNQTTPIYLGYTSPTCSKPVQILSVSVVAAGSGSSS